MNAITHGNLPTIGFFALLYEGHLFRLIVIIHLYMIEVYAGHEVPCIEMYRETAGLMRFVNEGFHMSTFEVQYS